MIRKIICWFFAAIFGITTLGGILSLTTPPAQIDTSDMLPFTLIFAGITIWFVWLAIKSPTPSKKQRAAMEEQQEEARYKAQIAAVKAVTELPIVEFPACLVLKPDEVCHYQCDARVRIVKNQVVGRTGGYRGASIRVAKGLTLHTGGSRGQSIRSNVPYDYPGIFSITSQRVIMTGEKGFEYPLNKLTAFTPYNGLNGINLQFGGKSYTLLMEEPLWVPKIIELIGEK